MIICKSRCVDRREPIEPEMNILMIGSEIKGSVKVNSKRPGHGAAVGSREILRNMKIR